MFYHPDPITSSMCDHCEHFDGSIRRVAQSWDDRVSQHLQTTHIHDLASAARQAIASATSIGDRLVRLLDEMEFYARR